jgi:hypothetical protein
MRNALGLFNLCWAAMFFIFMIVSIRANVFMIMIFACVTVTCVLSAIGDFQYADGHPDAKERLDKVRFSLLTTVLTNKYRLLAPSFSSAVFPTGIYFS